MTATGVTYHTRSIAARDGLVLHVHTWRQDKGARQIGRVLLVHGYLEHAGRYGALASTLAAAGFEVVACDLRGHGRSEGKRGYIASFGDYQADIELTMASAEARLPLPWWVIGHSLGGLVTLDALTSGFLSRSRSLCGAVVSNPYLAPALHIPLYKRFLGRLLSESWPSVALSAGIEAEALTRDKTMVAAIKEDRLITRKATARWFTETTRAQLRVLQATDISFPLWVLVGGHDAIADPKTTCEWFERLETPKDRQLDLRAQDMHELFFELGRAALHQAVTAWILARRPGA